MMPTRKDTAELHVARVAVALVEVALLREADALQSVVMAMMLVAEDWSAAVEAVVAKLAARSLAIMMTMVIGVS